MFATKRLLAALAMAALTGCASVEIASASADTEAKRFQTEATKAVVYVVQTGGVTSSFSLFQVNVGEKFAGAITDSTYLRVVAEPGDLPISISSQENQRAIRIRTTPGSVNFVGVAASMGWKYPRVNEVARLEQKAGMDAVKASRLAEVPAVQ